MKRLALVALAALAGCGAEPRPPQATQADRLNAAGSDALSHGRPRAAVARFSAAAEASASVDDRAGLSRDLHNRGLALIASGESEAGCTDLRESLRLADSGVEHAYDRACTRLALAATLVGLGKNDEAAAGIDLALAEATRDGDGALRARVLASRAALALRRGDSTAAAGDLAAAEPLCGPDAGAHGAVAVNRGHLALLNGDAASAEQAYDAAAESFRKISELAGLAVAVEGSARAAEAAGDRAKAAQAWQRAAQIPYGGTAARSRRLAEAARLAP